MDVKARHKWLCKRIDEERGGVDVLNSDFVTDYAEHTNTPAAVQFYGAPKCKALGADLAEMHRKGMLNRATIGIGDGLSGQGFPKWVYTYRLTTYGKHMAERARDEDAIDED